MLHHYLYMLAVIGAALASPKPSTLSFDDVVLLNADGSSTIVKEHEYTSLIAHGVLQLTPRTPIKSVAIRLENTRRGCAESSEVQVLSDTTFLNWDVPLSPVISAQGGEAQVSVSSGYSISNGISVSSGASASIIADVLSISMTTTFSQTWTSSQEQSLTYKVPSGQFGLIVSQPLVRRVQGNYLGGCTDAWTKEAFMADSYQSQAYGNLEWVQGVLRLCNSTTYPIPYCIGEGSHS